MVHDNAATERRVVDAADLRGRDVVLVVGPGPGIGLHAAGKQVKHAIGLDPSEVMLDMCHRRCRDLIARGRVRLEKGFVDHIGHADNSMDVVIAVNNFTLWHDWNAALTELSRVLRPGGRLLISAHARWLPDGPAALATAVRQANFVNIQTTTWEPRSLGAGIAAQLVATAPLCTIPTPQDTIPGPPRL